MFSFSRSPGGARDHTGWRSVLAIAPIGADESSSRLAVRGLREATRAQRASLMTVILRGFRIGRRRDGPFAARAPLLTLRRPACAVGREDRVRWRRRGWQA